MPTQKRLKELFDYNPVTGELKWNKPLWLKRRTTFISPRGANEYLHVTIVKFHTYVHRLAWTIANGQIPKGMLVDHIDHDRTNNKLSNLRLVTRTNSNRNLGKKRNNKSGTTGVYWYARKSRWCANISHNSHNIHLGSFSSLQDAIAARQHAERELGYHPNHGKSAVQLEQFSSNQTQGGCDGSEVHPI